MPSEFIGYNYNVDKEQKGQSEKTCFYFVKTINFKNIETNDYQLKT